MGNTSAFAPLVTVATPTALAAVSTKTFPTGTEAFVTTVVPYNSLVYVLQPAVGTVDGINIVAASGDVSRQWVRHGLLNDFISFTSPEIDLTTIASGFLVYPAVTGKTFLLSRHHYLITAVGGAISTAPSVSITPLIATATGLFTAAGFAVGVGWYQGINLANDGTGVPTPNQGGNAAVTIAATGTGSFVFRGKVVFLGCYV